jgi:glutaminyl-tRNA synthetase
MSSPSTERRPEAPPRDFIREIVAQDVVSGKHGTAIVTRFPPEPNGRLHIGHAKAICIDFGVAQEFGGRCNLRFDDTNPVKESQEYVDEIERDIKWLGFDWGEHLYHASDYFEQLYEWAEQLIRDGKAYVDSLTADEMREYRGTLTEPGRDSPYRNRPVAENHDLFRRMRAGEFEDGAHVLRAKIDMASGNINMRDPVMYRIRKTPHQRTGDKWVIYPMYDWAHGQSDYIEGVTYSLCSLEYEDHRPLYDWYLDALGHRPPRPRQIEFARLNLSYTVMSKRVLLELVEGGHVGGWDDPRMPTIAGLRKRGYTPESIRNFCDRIGVAKRNNVVDIANLEHAIREDLNLRAPRVMAVLNPVKVVIENYPEGQSEEVDVINNPEDSSAGTRKVPFGRELYIERDDFMEDPPRKFFRLSPGNEVRLRCAYFIKCTGVLKDPETGEITELRAVYDPATRGGDSPDGRKVKATLHWVSAAHALDAEVRIYDRLFTHEEPAATENFLDHLNPKSLEVQRRAKVEPSLANAQAGSRYQFERLGYFCVDTDSTSGALVFNRTVSLRDTWAKIAQKGSS